MNLSAETKAKLVDEIRFALEKMKQESGRTGNHSAKTTVPRSSS
jgi:hypothetical protein